MNENMRIHVKNVLAGIGTMAILAVALMIAIPNFANYDLGSTGNDSSLYTDTGTTTDGGDVVAESPNGIYNRCIEKVETKNARVCIVKKVVDPNTPPFPSPEFSFKLTQGSKDIDFKLKDGEFYGVDSKELVKSHRDDAKKQNVEDSFDSFSITETENPNYTTSYTCSYGFWHPSTGVWFHKYDSNRNVIYTSGNGNTVNIGAELTRVSGLSNPEDPQGRPFNPGPFYGVLCEFTNTLKTAPVGNTAKITIIKDYVPGQSSKVFPFEITGKNSDGKVFNTQTIRLNDDGVGDLDPKSQYPKQYTFTLYIKDNFGKILSYDVIETPDSTTTTKYLCKIKVPQGYRPKADIKGTGTKLNFTPAPGEEITCTFTNTKKGYINVYEEAEPYIPSPTDPINP